MDLDFVAQTLREKEYENGVKLKEPTIQNLKTVCTLLGIKDVWSMMVSLDADLLLLCKFEGDEKKCEAFLNATLQGGISNSILAKEGAFYLEVKNDFFTCFSQQSGLLKNLLTSIAPLNNVSMEFQAKPAKSREKSASPKSKRG